MRDDWTETAISDIADVLSGFAFKSELFSESGGIPLIRIRDLQKRNTTEVGYKGEYEERYVVNQGDFLIGMDGEFRCYEWLGPKALLNQRVCRIQTFDESRIVPRFIYFLVNQYLEKIEESTSFTTVKHISVKQVKDIRFPMPPLAEQKRIVDVVSSVDAYIDALQVQAVTARTARNAVLHELLSAGSDDWTETTLGEIITLEYGKPLKAENRDGKGFPVFGSAGEVGLHSEPLVNEAPVIVVGRKGTAGAVWWSDSPCSVIDTAFYVVQKVETNIHFLYLVLGFLDLPSLNAQTGVPGLNRDRAYSSELLLPPPHEQKRIVEIVSSMDDAVQSTEQAVVDAKNLRSGLLSDLLSGEHEIPDTYDKFLKVA